MPNMPRSEEQDRILNKQIYFGSSAYQFFSKCDLNCVLLHGPTDAVWQPATATASESNVIFFAELDFFEK
jgi:hypothetical protein